MLLKLKKFCSNKFLHSISRYIGVTEIAAKAPKLTFVHGERSEIRILDKNHAIEGVTQQELQEMKVQLISVLDNNQVAMAPTMLILFAFCNFHGFFCSF